MTEYQVELFDEPTHDLQSVVGEPADSNPFQTQGYAAARSKLGAEPVGVCLRQDGRPISGFLAFAHTGRLRRSLEIPSFPKLPPRDTDVLGTEIERVLTESGFTDIQVNSFASPPDLQIPRFRRELDRHCRREFVLDLSVADPLEALASNHKRNVKKAGKSGVICSRDDSDAACRSHVGLMTSSLQRREKRGELVSAGGDLATYEALVRHGAGHIYQARTETEILSSILVLRAPREAYYHSAGTTPKGMKTGASHFLITEVARELGSQGLQTFTLGGAEKHQTGLARFKSGFGAREIQLEAVRAVIGQRPTALVVLALHHFQQIRSRLSR